MPTAKREYAQLTVTAGLDGGLDVANALDGHAVLVVAVDELILKLTDLINEDTELVGDIRDVIVTSLAPNGQLLLKQISIISSQTHSVVQTYCDLHALPGD